MIFVMTSTSNITMLMTTFVYSNKNPLHQLSQHPCHRNIQITAKVKDKILKMSAPRCPDVSLVHNVLLYRHISQNTFFYVPQKKKSHQFLERHEGE